MKKNKKKKKTEPEVWKCTKMDKGAWGRVVTAGVGAGVGVVAGAGPDHKTVRVQVDRSFLIASLLYYTREMNLLASISKWTVLSTP